MRFLWLGCLLGGSLLLAGTQEPEINVNCRYTVQAVVLAGEGWRVDVASDRDAKISDSLRRDILALVGEKLNPAQLQSIARRIRREFHARSVTPRVVRGGAPEYVQVIFELKSRPTRFDVSVPKFAYHSKQGWTGEVEGTATVQGNSFSAGLVSNGDDLVERYAGVTARYERKRLGTDRAGLRFQFESYHEQWNGGTRALLDGMGAPADIPTSGLYRTRQNFEPVAVIALARPLTLSVGASFERFQEQYPAAHTEASNAMVATLRFHQHLEGTGVQQDADADYNLRAATRILDSDYAYARHRLHFRYTLTHGRTVLLDEVAGGMISGRAPLFERFVLGNSATLRGWNKYDLDPLGGDRMVHNTVEYRYGVLQVFYDTGSVWDRGRNAVVRHSTGIGFRQGSFSIAVAFPIKEGRAEPVFMVGMNY